MKKVDASVREAGRLVLPGKRLGKSSGPDLPVNNPFFHCQMTYCKPIERLTLTSIDVWNLQRPIINDRKGLRAVPCGRTSDVELEGL